MEFVVNSGGKVVKALRGSQDEGVRKRAVELTAQWKALVAGQLAAKKVVKKGDKDSEADEAGETWTARGPRTRKAHSARRALYGPVSSAAPPRSTWAEPDAARTGRGCRAAGVGRGGSSPARTRSHEEGRACSGEGVMAMAAARQATMVLHLSLFALLHLTPTADCYSPPPCGAHHFFAAGAASARPAAAGASASKIPPQGQLARPREGVVLKGGKVSLPPWPRLSAFCRSFNSPAPFDSLPFVRAPNAWQRRAVERATFLKRAVASGGDEGSETTAPMMYRCYNSECGGSTAMQARWRRQRGGRWCTG